jgi:hypothetical protein
MPLLQAEAVAVMATAFHSLERAMTPPQRIAHRDSFVPRYANKGIHEALIQKLARNISGLNSVAVLLASGYVQEAGVLFRTLDEIQEDIFFLATAETNGARTERHQKYLDAFYAEAVFSRPEGSLEVPKPNLVPRKKIRAHSRFWELAWMSLKLSARARVSELPTLATCTPRPRTSWTCTAGIRLISI